MTNIGLSAAVMLALAAGAAHADNVIEVSKDGRTQVELNGQTHTERPVLERGGPSAPFGLTPDWVLNLRRQVGVVRIGDFNGDGKNDLFVGCFISSSSPPYTDWRDMIFYNTGNTLEATPSWISADQVHTGDAQLGDINQDGHLDVFAATGGSGFAAPRIYFGSPTGPSTSPGWLATPPIAGWCTSASLFDVDNDGDLDVVTTNQGLDPNPYRPMYLFRNNAGVLGTSPVWQSAESSIQNTTAIADFDGDGFLDIAVAKWVNFETAIYRNLGGTPATMPIWTRGTTTADRGASVADVDGNGWPDLVIGGSPTRLFDNSGSFASLTPTWTAVPPFSGVQEHTFRDVNQDGRPDFGEIHFSDGRAHIYMNDNGVLSSMPSWSFDAPEVGNAIAFGDLNGDGWDDLVVGYSGNVSVRVFFAVPPPPPVCPGDANGDGEINAADLSVLLANFGTSTNGGASSGDFNKDGSVDGADLSVLLGQFGTSC